MHSPHHHPLLFSRWFPYLWKAIYKPISRHHEQLFYGNVTKGYYCRLDNGISFKIFKHGETGSYGALYAVYVYRFDKLIMNYNTISDSYIYIVVHNPLTHTSSVNMDYLLETIKKTIPDLLHPIFQEKEVTDVVNLPTLVFRISIKAELDYKDFYHFTIKYYKDQKDFSKYENIYLIKQFNEYFSGKHLFSLGYRSDGLFSDAIKKSHIDKICQIDSYTSSLNYYTLYPLSNPNQLSKLAPYSKPIVENSKGFVIEVDDEQYYFMFNYGFISYKEYRKGRLGNHNNIRYSHCSDDELEKTFVTTLKEVMLTLQKRKPSSKFLKHLKDLGIEGVNTVRRKGITDEQWLLYEMMDI